MTGVSGLHPLQQSLVLRSYVKMLVHGVLSDRSVDAFQQSKTSPQNKNISLTQDEITILIETER